MKAALEACIVEGFPRDGFFWGLGPLLRMSGRAVPPARNPSWIFKWPRLKLWPI